MSAPEDEKEKGVQVNRGAAINLSPFAFRPDGSPLGIDPTGECHTNTGRPTMLVASGRVMNNLFGG